jgi:hypothetical protein
MDPERCPRRQACQSAREQIEFPSAVHLVNRRHIVTPSLRGKSEAYEADRLRAPLLNHKLGASGPYRLGNQLLCGTAKLSTLRGRNA